MSEDDEAIARILASRATHYQKINISADATPDQIRKAYRSASLLVHPDRNHSSQAEEAFKALSEAFSVLSDVGRRAVYDGELRRASHRAATPKGHRPRSSRAGSASARANSAAAAAAAAAAKASQHASGAQYGPFAHDYVRSWQQRQQREASYASSVPPVSNPDDVARLRAEVAQLKREQQASQQAVSAARKLGFSEARDAMNRLSDQLAAAHTRNEALRREVESERLVALKAESEREALAGAVRTLARRLKAPVCKADAGGRAGAGGGSGTEAEPWRTVSGEMEMRVLLADALHRTLAAAMEPLAC